MAQSSLWGSDLLVKQQAAEFVRAMQMGVKGFELDMAQDFTRGLVSDHDLKRLIGSIE